MVYSFDFSQAESLCEQPSSSETSSKPSSHHKRSHRIRIKLKRNKHRYSSEKQEQSDQPKVVRALFSVGETNGSVSSSYSSSTSSRKASDSATISGTEVEIPNSPLTLNNESTNSLLSSDDRMPRISRKESLAQVFQEKLVTEEDEEDESEGECVRGGREGGVRRKRGTREGGRWEEGRKGEIM